MLTNKFFYFLGVEIMYEMYNPSIQSIEVLKLEKRLDEELFYLRDALPEYSTFSSDMPAELHAEGIAVPINSIKVPGTKFTYFNIIFVFVF